MDAPTITSIEDYPLSLHIHIFESTDYPYPIKILLTISNMFGQYGSYFIISNPVSECD